MSFQELMVSPSAASATLKLFSEVVSSQRDKPLIEATRELCVSFWPQIAEHLAKDQFPVPPQRSRRR